MVARARGRARRQAPRRLRRRRDGAAPARRASSARFLAERLPEYMVPSAFVALDALPLTAERQGRSPRAPRARARRAGERASRRAARPGRGGARRRSSPRCSSVAARSARTTASSSSAATRSWRRRRSPASARAFGVELPLRALFEAPTPAELAARVEAALRDGRGARRAAARARRRATAPLPLSFAQERLWFLDQLEPGRPVVHRPARAAPRGRARRRARSSARSREVVRRHEVLRTTFARRRRPPGRRSSTPASTLALPVDAIWPRCPPPSARPRPRARGRRRGARAPSISRAGPLLRARLLALGADDHVLLVDDAPHRRPTRWTHGHPQPRARARSTRAFRAGAPSPLPELPIQYADYAAWQRALALGRGARAAARLLEEAARRRARARSSCPTDRPRPPVQSLPRRRGAASRSRAELARGARGARRAARASTLFMTLLAAFDVLLHRYTGQGDVVVGTPDRRTAPAPRPRGSSASSSTRWSSAPSSPTTLTLPRAARARARGLPRRLRAPGHALRAPGAGARARARSQPRRRSSR